MPKQFSTKESSGKEVHHHQHYHLQGQGFESFIRDAGKYLQPVADSAQNRAIKEINGNGLEDLFRDAGKYLQPVADAAQNRAMREIKGNGRRPIKGSQEAKDKMARVRAMKMKK
jgi:hypothetical protein